MTPPDPREPDERLATALRTVETSVDFGAVLRGVLDVAVEVMRAQRGFLVLRDGSTVVASQGSAPGEDVPASSIVARVMGERVAVFTTDAQAGADVPAERSIAARQLRSIACVPLRLPGGDLVGALYLDSRVVPGLFEPGDRERLVRFASDAALAIEKARLFHAERERGSRVAELQAFQSRILEAIANGVVTFSPQGTITTFNRSAEATFGIPAEAVIGHDAEELARAIPDLPELVETFLLSGAVQLRAEVAAQGAAGSPLTVHVQLAPLHEAGGVGIALVVVDVTEYRLLEEKHAAELVRSRRVGESFARYLAPHVVKSLMDDPGAVRLGGERSRATMLFADICGFTSMAAALPADRVVELLNAYFEEAVRIVFEHEGLLDKFYGDGVMAVFGPPRVRPGDAARAVSAAIRLHEAVAVLRPALGYDLRISVGIATGEVVAGHVGAKRRMDYTVIGDAVNMAGALRAAAPSGTIYCDEETIANAGTLWYPVERLALKMKGRARPVQAYSIVTQPG